MNNFGQEWRKTVFNPGRNNEFVSLLIDFVISPIQGHYSAFLPISE